MNGPPLALYGSLRGWSPQQFWAKFAPKRRAAPVTKWLPELPVPFLLRIGKLGILAQSSSMRRTTWLRRIESLDKTQQDVARDARGTKSHARRNMP
jgi:hypothetical protein